MRFIAYAAAGLAPALLWLAWVLHKDRANPEPARLVLRAFVLGALATGVVLLLRPYGEDLLPQGTGLDRALADAFLLTATLEEFAKGTALLVAILNARQLDEPLDGIVYGAAVGLGFASVENALYVAQVGDPQLALLRGGTSTLAHLATTGVFGFLLACARLSRGRDRLIYAACAFPNAWIYHGCYDVFLFAPGGELAWISLACVLPLLFTIVGLAIRWSHRHRRMAVG